MVIGTGCEIKVTLDNGWSSDIGGLWIDWNQDGDFDEEITTDWMGTGPYMTTIYPPLDAVLGTTWMRVRIQDGDHSPHLSPYDIGGYGEVEDYSTELVEADEESGSGSYLDVIQGIQFVVDYKDYFNVRVLNLSFSAEPLSYYLDFHL